jgi:4'-phosphopantetheinyl transferase
MVIDLYKIFNIENLTDDMYNKYFSMMSKSRKEKVLSLKDEASRKRTVAGEMLVKQMLSNDIVIETGDNGKPYTENAYFSISHKEKLVVCTVSDKPIGIDIEKIMPYNDKLARRITNDAEYDYINKNGEKLTEIWTLKEAIIKKDGKGISSIKSTDALSQINKQKYVYEAFLIHIAF